MEDQYTDISICTQLLTSELKNLEAMYCLSLLKQFLGFSSFKLGGHSSLRRHQESESSDVDKPSLSCWEPWGWISSLTACATQRQGAPRVWWALRCPGEHFSDKEGFAAGPFIMNSFSRGLWVLLQILGPALPWRVPVLLIEVVQVPGDPAPTFRLPSQGDSICLLHHLTTHD